MLGSPTQGVVQRPGDGASELITWEQAQYDGFMPAYSKGPEKALDAHASIQCGTVSIVDASV